MVVTSLRFGDVEADGEHVSVKVTIELAGLLERELTVRLSEDTAHRLVVKFQAAIARLNRTRLGA